MTDWIEQTAGKWRGGQYDRCESGHISHKTQIVTAKFMGNDNDLPLEVFDFASYENTPGYCPGNDDVSKSIGLHQNYERPESAMVREILGEGDKTGVVIDIGAHVGWYTCMAALYGYRVLAIDADTEHLRVLENNLRILSIEDRVTTVRGWFGPKTPVLDEFPGEGIRLVKADIEGLEDQVLRVLGPALLAQQIDYLLVEISPVLAAHYPETVVGFLELGYTGYVVPGNTDQELWGDPLEGHRHSVAERVASWHQHNVVFVRRGLPHG